MTQPAPIGLDAMAAQAQAAPVPQQDEVDILVGGRPATVPRADLSTALSAGATLATPIEAAGSAKPGGLMGAIDQAMAWQNAGLAGGTAGLGQAGIHKGLGLFSPELASKYKSGIEKQAADFPTTNTVGELGGMVAASLVPIGGAARGAAGVARAAQVANETGGLAKGLGLIARSAAEAAGQQSAYNIGKQISEDELGDHELNGEKIFAAATNKDMLLAGALGAGFGAAGQLVKSVKPSIMAAFKGRPSAAALDATTGVEGAGRAVAADARETEAFVNKMQGLGHTSEQAAGIASDLDAASKAEGPITSMLDTAVASYADGQAARAGGKDARALLEQQYRHGVEGKLQRDARFDAMGRDLSKDADDVLRKAVDNVDDVQFTQKREQMAKLVDAESWRGARDAALNVWQDTKKVVEFWEGTNAKGGAEGAVKRARKWLSDFEAMNGGIGDIATQAEKSKVAAELFSKVDDFKRQIAPGAQFGRSKFGLPEAAQDFDALYHRIRTTLEDESVWGKAGAAQRDNNAAVTNFLGKSDAFRSQFGAVTLEREAGRPVLDTDPAKFKSFLRSLGGAEGDKPRQVLREYLESVIHRTNAAKAHYEIPAKQLGELNAGAESASRMLRKLDAHEGEALKLSKLELAIDAEHHGGAHLGGLGGMVADAYTAPYRTMARLAQIRRLTNSVDEAFGKSIRDLLDGGGGVRRVGAQAGRTREAVIREIEGVQVSGRNVEGVADRAAKAIGQDVQQAAPKHSAAIGATLARAVNYLASQAPQGRSSTSLIPNEKEKLRYSEHELERYARTSEAVHNPAKVIAEASEGRLSREGVNALKAVYPKIYDQMRLQVMDQLSDMAARGELEKIPYQRRILLGILLQTAADGTQRPEVMAEIQRLKMANPEQPAQKPGQGQPQGGGRRPIQLDSKDFQTDADRIESGGRV